MIKNIILILSLIVFLTSCDNNRVFDQYKSLPNQWPRDSVITFKVPNLDSLKTYNLFINIRNTDAYRYNNLYLVTAMNFPNGKVVQDTLEYEMAYPDGAWMGVGFTESKASKLWYKKGVRFKENGDYTFTIRQAMRRIGEKEGIENLQGITEVGLRIEEAPQVEITDKTAGK